MYIILKVDFGEHFFRGQDIKDIEVEIFILEVLLAYYYHRKVI